MKVYWGCIGDVVHLQSFTKLPAPGVTLSSHQVMDNALPNMSSAGGQQQVWRAQFSSLAPVDLKRAMANLGSPNKDMSDSVDARADA